MCKPSPLAKRLANRLIALGLTLSEDVDDLCIKRNQWAICNHVRGGSEQFGWEFVNEGGYGPAVTWEGVTYTNVIIGGMKPISELVRCRYISIYVENDGIGKQRLEVIGGSKP